MKENDINQLTNRLQGFDGDVLLDRMTDGLDAWCHRRRQRARTAKRVVLLALLLLTTTAIAMTVVQIGSGFTHTPDSTLSVPTPRPARAADGPVTPVDEHTPVLMAEELPVDYHYKGIAEEGYSVTYGRDTRTLTYTRYSGSHLIKSVIHDVPDDLFRDTMPAAGEAVAAPLPSPTRCAIPCDFQTVEACGDAFYFTVTDSLRRTVSLRGDVAEWMGQPIRYRDTLVLPATVEHDGVVYTVTALADSAFAGHSELRAVVLPSTLRHLGDMAFARCTGVQRLTVLSDLPPEAMPASFDRMDAELTLIVPCGSRGAYEDDVEWMYFRNIGEECNLDLLRPRIHVIRR